MSNEIQDHLVSLDVRAGIKAGIDPFTEIMAAVKVLADHETLQIINIFEPIPLINKMKAKGYRSWTERPEESLVHTFFKRESTTEVAEELPEITASNETEFEKKLVTFCNKITKIDVRNLEMPEPMTTILQALESLPDDHALFVEHKKMPQFLLPELKNRNYSIAYNEIDGDNLQLLIFKAN
jgi:uncharacterized protein (DUF2249 family)